jgi:alpha-tubulin suppressor-like RCC1 family protein
MNVWKSIISLLSSPKYLLSTGNNFYGELGDNTTTHKSSPIQTIAGGTDWHVVANGSFYSGAIKTDGTLWLWGDNYYNLGDGTTTKRSSPVQTVAGGTDWIKLSCGYSHVGSIKDDGTLWMWGRNFSGALGDGTTTNIASPIQTISSGTDWSSIACGGYHTAAIKTDGTLWVWGYNNNGQLGDNTTTNKSSPIQTIAGGTDWSSVVCGYTHTTAIKTDGTLWVWGGNGNGQLGDNTVTDKSSPIQTISSGTDWSSVSNGVYHTTAIKTDGTLWLWGWNNRGQLGDNTTTHKSSPIQTIAGGTDWAISACGYAYTTATKSDGTWWSWGWNNRGQLGDNTIIDKSSPIQNIAGGTDWVQPTCGWDHTSITKS